MELDLSEGKFQLTDPWRLYFPAQDNIRRDGVSHFTPLDFELGISSEINPYASEPGVAKELRLPDLDTFHYGAVQDIPLSDESTGSIDDNKAEDTTEELANIWGLVVDEQPLDNDVVHRTWEAFQQPGQNEQCSAYLSEAGPEIFDVALRIRQATTKVPETIPMIQTEVFLQSVFALGLGRSSVLFAYDAKKRDFERTIADCNISGFSTELSDSYIEKIMACGRLTCLLRDSADRTYTSTTAIPARVALAKSIATIIDALEQHLTTASKQVLSLLQIQQLFERPSRLLREVYDLMKHVRNARTNEELASLVFARCQNCDQEPEWLRRMILQIFSRVTRPGLEIVEQWIGLKDDTGDVFDKAEQSSAIFVSRNSQMQEGLERETDLPDERRYCFDPNKLPSFISDENGQKIFNIGRDIRILRRHHPGHPLSQPQQAHGAISLDWQFSWQDIDRIAQRAGSFEAALTTAVNSFQARRTQHHRRLFSDKSANEEPVATINDENSFRFEGNGIFSAPLQSENLPRDELFNIVITSLSRDSLDPEPDCVDFAPPMAIVPTLSFNPLLAAQQRIMNAVMIRLFLRSHQLRKHIDLQRSFHLLGDGVFVSRLTSALFDPNQSSTERQRGVMRSGTGMGLRLGSRGTWPPASSELRLALMGILTESYHASFIKEATNGNHDLPGGLSFAIRHLSEEEADRVLKADSLHALDFLRLQYSPPSPLGAVLTPATLERYDSIFKFLLRLARLLFVVSHLPKFSNSHSACSFRTQAEYFVSTSCRYFFDTGVSETWAEFSKYLDGIEERLLQEDRDGELGSRVSEGIEDLRKQHDLCLDRITFALLLRNRQQKVMKVLEDILTAILEFSRLCHETGDAGTLDARTVEQLHLTFQTHVKLFIEVCKGLVGKRGYGKSGSENRGSFGHKAYGEANTIERLVVVLDYNGFYERRVQ